LLQPLSTPWIAIFTSLPMWAIIVAHAGNNFGHWVLLTQIPTYMKSILQHEIKEVRTLWKMSYWTLRTAELSCRQLFKTFPWTDPRLLSQQNGLLSALPYLSLWLSSLVVAWLILKVNSSGLISLQLSRKICNTIGTYHFPTFWQLFLKIYFLANQQKSL